MLHFTILITFFTFVAARNIINPAPIVSLYYSPPLPLTPRHDSPPDFKPSVSIQTLLGSLVKLGNVTEFSCSEEGTFPHPLDCSKYYHCDKELKVGRYILVILIVIRTVSVLHYKGKLILSEEKPCLSAPGGKIGFFRPT